MWLHVAASSRLKKPYQALLSLIKPYKLGRHGHIAYSDRCASVSIVIITTIHIIVMVVIGISMIIISVQAIEIRLSLNK